MFKLKWALFTLPVILSCLLLAVDAKADVLWEIVAVHNNKCVDIKGNSTAARALAQVYGCHEGDNQSYTFESVGGGYYRIIAKHSGMCLDVRNASTRPGRNVQQFGCHTGDNQKWKKLTGLNGQILLQNKNSGLCLTAVLPNDPPRQKDILEQRGCSINSTGGRWRLRLADCGDGSCRPIDGEDIFNCPVDCNPNLPGPPIPACFNGICEAGESCSSCPSDCQPCDPISCGDGFCEVGEETCSSCPLDCGICSPGCGNGFCDFGEDCFNCAQDCGPNCPVIQQ